MKRRQNRESSDKLIYELRNKISDLLFPRRCFVCDQVLNPWELTKGAHEDCLHRVSFITGNTCLHCGAMIRKEAEFCPECKELPGDGLSRKEKGTFTQGKSLFVYKGVMKSAMYRFKYSGKQEYALAFAEEAFRSLREWIWEKKIDAVIPVPMFRTKERMRGYNQAEALADAIGSRFLLPVFKNCIVRVADTKPMKTLSKEERRENLKNAFQMASDMVQYTQIPLIVDDIYTTGATADAISSLLLRNGIEKVYFMSVCMGRDV